MSDSNNFTSNSTAAKMITLGELHTHKTTTDTPVVIESLNPLLLVKAKLQVCVGEANISVGELINAKEHHVVVLDRTTTQPVDLLLDGKVIARGQLVAVDDHFAVRITELPIPLKTS